MTNATIQVRTDAEVKDAADSIFNRLGITMSDGINIFLRQVNLYGGFPFEIKLPSAETFGASRQQGIAHIQSLCGKYHDSKFSTDRYFDQKRRDKVKEK